MSLFSGLLKAGLAKKVFTEASKPANQQKAKEMFAKARQGRRGGTPGPR